MADASDTPNPDELGKQIAELTKKLEAQSKALENLEKERDDYKARFEDSKTSRDKHKQKEKEEAEKRGEYEKAMELTKAELEAKAAELEKAKSDLELLKGSDAKLKAIEAKERERLLALLPDDKREKFAEYTIESLQDIVELAGDDPSPSVDGPRRRAKPVNDKTWAEMSAEERVDLTRANPEEARQRMKQFTLSQRR